MFLFWLEVDVFVLVRGRCFCFGERTVFLFWWQVDVFVLVKGRCFCFGERKMFLFCWYRWNWRWPRHKIILFIKCI